MTLQLDDYWIWDFWLATEAGTHHIFFLKAPKAIGDPDLRHWNVAIGHAVSDDLQAWTVVEDALSPSTTPGWDDRTTWTGSVLRHHNSWVMMYTGTCHAEGLVQRIGLATSPDLFHWEQPAHPVLTADPTHYETLSHNLWHDEAWRDPWLFADPSDGHLHVFLTARSNVGNRFDRGAIGHARSADLINWEVLPPILIQPGFGQLEVPQLIDIDGRWYLLFASDTETQSPEQRAHGPGTGTYYLVSDSPFGPFTMIGNGALDVDTVGSTYAGRIHRTSDGVPWYLAWQRVDEAGSFAGYVTEPRRVHSLPDGSLALDGAEPR